MAIDLYGYTQRYEKGKKKFRKITKISNGKNFIKVRKENKKYALEWLNKKEERLKKINGYETEAQIRYCKTLSKEITFLKNVLIWFNDIDLKKLCLEKLENVYEGLEKGEIVATSGKALSDSSREDYYKKVFKGDNTFFGYLDKSNLAKQVIIRKFRKPEIVRFFDDDIFYKIVNSCKLISHKLAFWILYDTGTEINAVLQLKKSDFTKNYDEDDNETFYKVNIRLDISKKNRQKRHLDILNPELNRLLENYLDTVDDYLFNFKPGALRKALNIICKNHNLRTRGEIAKHINIKDFRNSMATGMLKKGYSSDDIKGRLGQKWSSRAIDRYISHLGLNQEKMRKKLVKSKYIDLQKKYDNLTEKTKIQNNRFQEKLDKEIEERLKLSNDMINIKNLLTNPKIKQAIDEFIN